MFKKCMKCGKVIYELNGSTSTICCNEKMKELIPNSVDAAKEKHVPDIEVVNNKIIVTVNHVMDEDHYIEWIVQESNDEIIIKRIKIGENPQVEFDYKKDSKVYSYCNKHGLWLNTVEKEEN